MNDSKIQTMNLNSINPTSINPTNYDRAWLEEARLNIGADIIGVLAVREDSHRDFLAGVNTFLPSAKAAVIVGIEYASEVMNLVKHPLKYAGAVKTGELLTPHKEQLSSEVDQATLDLARQLKKQGHRSLTLPSMGIPFLPHQFKAALSYAHIAEAAGMGTIGTHSLLITPEFGTRVRLGCLLTEAPLQTTQRVDPVDDCTHCLDCVKICPVGAIASPNPTERYKIEAATCKFYRERVDNCGLCQKVCSYATGHSENSGGPLAADTSFQESVSNAAYIDQWGAE